MRISVDDLDMHYRTSLKRGVVGPMKDVVFVSNIR